MSHLDVPRKIIHVDLDAFYCAVEEQRDPSLKGQAFAVGGLASERGVVASCSYAARRCGVRSAMSMAHAQRLCPQLVVVATRHSHYRAVSSQVMDLLRSVTAQLEQISIDEAFLDVTQIVAENQSLSGRSLALDIQRRILDELNLSCSVGVASNKMVAKIATDCGKATIATGQSPHALCAVETGEEARFLAPLPVSALWGVGPKMETALKNLGIETIGELAQWPERDLAKRFGRHGFDLAQHAHGIDKREIVTEREAKSISSETTFLKDLQEWEDLHACLIEQAESVATQLQRQQLQATTVKLKLRWSDFTFSTRQTTVLTSTAEAKTIGEVATALLRELWKNGAPVRLLGVGVSGLSPVRQLGLFDSTLEEELSPPEPTSPQEVPNQASAVEAENFSESTRYSEERRQRLHDAVALLEARFGTDVVHLGARQDETSRLSP